MNYRKIYDSIVERARNRPGPGLFERHHIIPKCMGGTNKTENLVKLTPEEHFVCHQLLVRIYPKNNGLMYAAWIMRNRNINNKGYGWIKRRISETPVSIETRLKRSKALKGRVVLEETRQKISNAKKNPSSETRRKIGKAQRGKVVSEYTRQLLSEAGKGKVPSAETRKKISDRLTGRISPLRGICRSEEFKKKISTATKGSNNPFFNKKHSNETKQRISKTKIAQALAAKRANMSIEINI